MQFHIGPKYQYKSWLDLENNFGVKWPLTSLDDSIKRGFGNLPYHKLKRIQINIEAPEMRDPGQVLCLHKKCTNLAELLEQAKQGLPDIEISLFDSSSAQWSLESGEAQRSIWVDRRKHYPPEFNKFDTGRENIFNRVYDYIVVLQTFSRLRNARSAIIHSPNNMRIDHNFMEGIALTLMEREPTGSYLDADDSWDDATLQKEMDEIYMGLDLDLDVLPGPTANWMRLDRFSCWYSDKFGGESKYEKEYIRLTGTLTDDRAISRWKWSLYKRYACLLAFNPTKPTCPDRSTKDLTLLILMNDLFLSDDVKTMNEAVDLGSIVGKWTQDAWHKGRYAWPKGIPPFESEECSSVLKSSRREAVTRQLQESLEQSLFHWEWRENIKFVNSRQLSLDADLVINLAKPRARCGIQKHEEHQTSSRVK